MEKRRKDFDALIYYWNKLKELKHNFVFKSMARYPGLYLSSFKYSHDFCCQKDAYLKYKKSETRKSLAQIKREIRLCKKYWHCYPFHYFRYGLFEQDKQLTDSQLINFVPDFFYNNLYLPYFFPKRYLILIKDKNVQDLYLRSLQINVPKVLVKIIRKKVFDSAGFPLDNSGFLQLLASITVERIFVKPADGKCGCGIQIFKREKNGFYSQGTHFDYSYLIKIGLENDWILQEGIVQDAQVQEMNSSSVNTFRIVTQNIDGEVKILYTLLRMSRNDAEVDNGSQGGLMLPIDVITGYSGDIARANFNEQFYKHPKTGFIFRGFRVNKWPQIRDFILESASKIVYFPILGWDIALSEDGPVAIEMDCQFGLDSQEALGGVKEILQIDDPDLYWRKLPGAVSC